MADKEKLEPRIKTSEQKFIIYIPRYDRYTDFMIKKERIMTYYINKKDAMEQSCDACDGYPCPIPCPSYRAMDKLPTIDIVQCGECINKDTDDCPLGYDDCGDDWFCADGERRTK